MSDQVHLDIILWNHQCMQLTALNQYQSAAKQYTLNFDQWVCDHIRSLILTRSSIVISFVCMTSKQHSGYLCAAPSIIQKTGTCSLDTDSSRHAEQLELRLELLVQVDTSSSASVRSITIKHTICNLLFGRVEVHQANGLLVRILASHLPSVMVQRQFILYEYYGNAAAVHIGGVNLPIIAKHAPKEHTIRRQLLGYGRQHLHVGLLLLHSNLSQEESLAPITEPDQRPCKGTLRLSFASLFKTYCVAKIDP